MEFPAWKTRKQNRISGKPRIQKLEWEGTKLLKTRYGTGGRGQGGTIAVIIDSLANLGGTTNELSLSGFPSVVAFLGLPGGKHGSGVFSVNEEAESSLGW